MPATPGGVADRQERASRNLDEWVREVARRSLEHEQRERKCGSATLRVLQASELTPGQRALRAGAAVMTLVRCSTPGCETLVAVEVTGPRCARCRRAERPASRRKPQTLDAMVAMGLRSRRSFRTMH